MESQPCLQDTQTLSPKPSQTTDTIHFLQFRGRRLIRQMPFPTLSVLSLPKWIRCCPVCQKKQCGTLTLSLCVCCWWWWCYNTPNYLSTIVVSRSLSVTLGKFYLSMSAFSSRVGTSVPHPKPRGHSLVHPSLFFTAHLPGFLCEMTTCYEKSGGRRMLATGTPLSFS